MLLYDILEKQKEKRQMLLYDIIEKLGEYFGVTAIFLISNDDALTYISVLCTGDAAEAEAILTRFEDEWWLVRMGETGGKICICLEFGVEVEEEEYESE